MDWVPGRTWGWLGPSGSLCNELFSSLATWIGSRGEQQRGVSVALEFALPGLFGLPQLQCVGQGVYWLQLLEGIAAETGDPGSWNVGSLPHYLQQAQLRWSDPLERDGAGGGDPSLKRRSSYTVHTRLRRNERLAIQRSQQTDVRDCQEPLHQKGSKRTLSVPSTLRMAGIGTRGTRE
jgi:hypothetical protein